MIEHQSPSIFCPTIAGSFHLRGPSRCRPAGGRKAEQKGFSSESAAFKQSSCRFRGTLPFTCPWPRLCHLATSCFKEGRRIQSFFPGQPCTQLKVNILLIRTRIECTVLLCQRLSTFLISVGMNIIFKVYTHLTLLPINPNVYFPTVTRKKKILNLNQNKMSSPTLFVL